MNSLIITIPVAVLCVAVFITVIFIIWWKLFRVEPYVLPEGFFKDDSKKEEDIEKSAKNEKDVSISHPNNLLPSTSAEGKNNSTEQDIVYLKNFFSDGSMNEEQNATKTSCDSVSHPNQSNSTINTKKDCIERATLGRKRLPLNFKVPDTIIPIISEEPSFVGDEAASKPSDLPSSAETETSGSPPEVERFCIGRNSLRESFKRVSDAASNTQDTVLNTVMGRRGVYEVQENEMRDCNTEIKRNSELVPLKRFSLLNASVLDVWNLPASSKEEAFDSPPTNAN